MKYLLANLDISAQEPLQVALLSKEGKYLSLFRNRVLREKGLTRYIDWFVSKYFHMDVNQYSEKSVGYWNWLDKFEWNTNDLVYFNEVVSRYLNGDESVKNEMVSILEKWMAEIDDSINKARSK